MSRSPQKFWLVITVLLLRLVVGEFAHASSMMAMPVEHQHSAMHCSDHSAQQEHDDSARTHGQIPGHTDSCAHGGCECPCVHASTLAVGVEVFLGNRASEPLAPPCATEIPQGRPNSPFRPPA